MTKVMNDYDHLMLKNGEKKLKEHLLKSKTVHSNVKEKYAPRDDIVVDDDNSFSG